METEFIFKNGMNAKIENFKNKNQSQMDYFKRLVESN